MAFKNLIVETVGHVGVIRLNRPKAANALSSTMITELVTIFDQWEKDDNVRVLVLTGSEKAFSSGADIKEMADQNFVDVYKADFITTFWDRLGACRKPIIAAVSGYAIGGGCELAMMCDFIVASETAMFGQNEVTLGIMPGVGGTQRLTRLVGKAIAMDMCLTGRTLNAHEAQAAGLVAQVVPTDRLMDEVMKIADRIAGMSLPITMMIKEAVNHSQEMSLSAGLRFERRLFHASFATRDQKEGMAAFIEKREPRFTDS